MEKELKSIDRRQLGLYQAGLDPSTSTELDPSPSTEWTDRAGFNGEGWRRLIGVDWTHPASLLSALCMSVCLFVLSVWLSETVEI